MKHVFFLCLFACVFFLYLKSQESQETILNIKKRYDHLLQRPF